MRKFPCSQNTSSNLSLCFQAALGLIGRRGVVSLGYNQQWNPWIRLGIVPGVPGNRPGQDGRREARPHPGKVRQGQRPGVCRGLHPALLEARHGRVQGLQGQHGEGGKCIEISQDAAQRHPRLELWAELWRLN